MFRRIALAATAALAVIAAFLVGAAPTTALPLPVTTLSASAPASITATWDTAAYPVVTSPRSYTVTFAYTGASSGSFTVDSATSGVTVAADPAYSYTASVEAFDNSVFVGTYSDSSPVTPTGLAKPAFSSVVASNAQVALAWATVPGAGYYSITRNGTTIVSSTARTSFTDTGLVNGTPYTYVVQAHVSITTPASVVDSLESSARTATPVTVPGKPTGAAETAGDRQITLRWVAPVSNGGTSITDYRVITRLATALPACTTGMRSPCAAIPYGKNSKSPVRIIKNVGPEKPLAFAVQAKNAKGWSSTSNYATAVQPYTSVPPFGLGTRGPIVTEIQKRLNWAGLTVPITGVFDSATKKQVQHLQEKFLYDESGVVTLSTWKLLRRITADGATLPSSCRGTSLCISKTQRLLRYVVNGKVVRSFDVRFGPEGTGFRTPEGVFQVNWKDRVHTSSEYGSPMPMTMNFVGGVAVHYSYFFNDVGYWGNSHGCVNVRDWAGLTWVYDRVSVGTRVVVYW